MIQYAPFTGPQCHQSAEAHRPHLGVSLCHTKASTELPPRPVSLAPPPLPAWCTAWSQAQCYTGASSPHSDTTALPACKPPTCLVALKRAPRSSLQYGDDKLPAEVAASLAWTAWVCFSQRGTGEPSLPCQGRAPCLRRPLRSQPAAGRGGGILRS